MASGFTIAQFRIDFPEFASEVKFPDDQITFWEGIGEARLNITRWNNANLLLQGLELFTAHQVSVWRMNMDSSNADNPPGTEAGLLSGFTAGSVSANVDTSATIEADAGNYNLTSYGREFLRLARIIGIGGAQL